MFCGKTTALISRIDRHQRAERVIGREILVFNHADDTRYGSNVLANHLGVKVEAIAVCDSAGLLEYVCNYTTKGYELKPQFADTLREIFIDEAQFFDENLPAVVEYLDRVCGVDISLAGLDTDFRGLAFGPMGNLMAIADEVQKHTAICEKKTEGKKCGEAAQQTQRLVNGIPANFNDPIILVGSVESYTPRCHDHHEIPGKPSLKPKR